MRSNQYAESCVRRAPLAGMPFERMMSYAEIRSVATKRRVLASSSKISRTLPEATFFRPEEERSRVVMGAGEDILLLVNDVPMSRCE